MPLPQQKPKSNVRRIGTIAFDETQMKNMIGVNFKGRYPTVSRDGNKYILVMYDYDSNAILATAIKSRQAAHIRDGFLELYTILY